MTNARRKSKRRIAKTRRSKSTASWLIGSVKAQDDRGKKRRKNDRRERDPSFGDP
jgi:hypothetical protein